MMKRVSSLTRLLILSLMLGCMALMGCASDNDDTSGTSTVQGNVAQVVMAMGSGEVPRTRYANLIDFLTLVRTAHAQDVSLGGIKVTALLGPIVVSMTTTDASGNFELPVPPGLVTLRFETDDFTLSLEMLVLESTTISMTVTLDTNNELVIVDEKTVEAEQIECDDELMVPEDEGTFTIQGDGGVCIMARGNCDITIKAKTIEMMNCQQCVNAAGNTSVSLMATESITCDATEEAVLIRGTADVTMMVTDESDDDNSDATGNATTSVARNENQEGNNQAEPDEPDIDVNADALVNARGNTSVEIMAEHIAAETKTVLIDAGGNSSVQLAAIDSDEADSSTDQTDGPVMNIARNENQAEDSDGPLVNLLSGGEGIVVFGSAEVTITSEGNIEIFTANGAVDASGKSKLKIHAEATTESGDAIEGEEMEGQGDVTIEAGIPIAVTVKSPADVEITAAGTCTVAGFESVEGAALSIPDSDTVTICP